MELIDIIKARLSSLEPTTLELIDQSALHIGHAGNTGGGHFQLKIVSSHFSNLSQIARHRMVYQVIHDLMPQKIHAMSILAISPNDPITITSK
ncbi:MAG: transcriptional regulator [Methylophilales bacterium 28-44-11]|jgi:BolA protein|nr:MAG: transcriptional regulator [Methylophilales bacterium 28-44-11]